MIPTTFTPGKKYALDGATLQAFVDELGTCRLLPSDQYNLEITAGKGTRITGIKASADSLSRWDLVADGSGGHSLFAPLILTAYGSATAIAITNTPVTLAANKWLVLQIDDISASPYTMTLALANPESGGDLKVYTFDGSDDLSLVRLPIYYLSATASPGAVQYGSVWGVKYITSAIQTLGSFQVAVPSRPTSRSVPRLISL